MDAHVALLGRRTVPSFTDEPVPDEVLDRALLAAHHAPNHRLTWPWRFLVLGPTARARLAEIAVRLKGAQAPLDPAAADAIRRGFTTPGALVAVARRLHPDPAVAREDLQAVACAIQNLQLALFADGWGTKWGTGAVVFRPETAEALGVDPAVEVLEALVYVGRPRTVPAVARPPLADVVRRLP